MKQFTWLLLLFGGCVSSIEPDPARLGVNFYPLQTGSYLIYQAKSVDFNLDGTIDSTVYFLREEIVDSFPSSDNEGYTFIINQYKKGLFESEWAFELTFSSRSTNRTVVTNEGNTAYVKLTFPMQEGLTWDGNSLNDFEPDSYEIRMLNHPFKVDSITFANTVHVFQADLLDPAKISADDYRVEVYADSIGLVFKEIIQKEYCDYSAGGPCSEPTVLTGFEYEQKLIEFGKI